MYYRYSEIARALAVMSACDMLPISFVVGVGFKYLCSVLEPDLKVPTAPVVRSNLRKLYTDMLPTVKEAMTCDLS